MLLRSDFDNAFVSGVKYCLEVIDTGGSCEFPAMQTLAIRSADAIVLVYSIDNRDSFERLESLRDQIFCEKEEDEVTVHVLANKTDLEAAKREVSFSEADMKIKVGWDISLSEVSAKSGELLDSKLTEIIPPTFLTGIGPFTDGKRNSGDNGSGVSGKRKSISEALSKPFMMMSRGSSRRRDTTANPHDIPSSSVIAKSTIHEHKPPAGSRMSIG